MQSISTILIEQWYIIYLYMLMCIVHMWIFSIHMHMRMFVHMTCIWCYSWPSFIMMKYSRGCKVKFYHAQYIPWNIKPLKTYMASKARHPNECFDTILCNGIFPVTRPFLFFAHYPNVLLLCYARVSSPPARVSWQMQVSDTIMDQSSMTLLGPATCPWSKNKEYLRR